MEGPLLSKSDTANVANNGDNSSTDEHRVNITADGDFSSTLAQIPYVFAIVLNSLEFVMTLVQIVVAIVIVKGAKGDHDLEATWIILYTCGCIAYLPVLCWSFWNTTSNMGINSVVVILKLVLEYFFLGWSLVFFWVFVSNSSTLDHTTPLFWLCVVFLAFGCIRYVLPNLICGAMCCCMSVTLCIGAIWGGIN